jgi:ferredoxin
MADFTNRFPRNVPGKYYVDVDCTDCDLCRDITKGMITRDSVHGYSFVQRQPDNAEESALFEEAVTGCPTSAVGSDGDRFDWNATEILDWGLYSSKLGDLISGLTRKATADKAIVMPLFTRYLFRREHASGPFAHVPPDYDDKKDGVPEPRFAERNEGENAQV